MARFSDEMLTVKELAEYLKLTPQTVYRWAQSGKLPGSKFGKEWRFRRSAIEEWIDEQMAPGARKSRSSAKKRKTDRRRSPGGSSASKN